MSRFVRPAFALLALAASWLVPSVAGAAMPFVDMQTESSATYDAVQTLYDRHVIFDNGTHLFNPRGLIARDDFTSIVMEVGCERCLQPTPDIIFAYTSRVFEDVGFDNENFYCIARAESLGVVRGYVLDESGTVSCQDKTVHSSVPFCPVNNITRIEAAAVLLRHAGFWDETRNASDYDHRYAISDISEYWYGYAMRALDFELFPIDASGRVSPNEYINRAEFARMAAKILRSRICEAAGSDVDDRFRTSRGDAYVRYTGGVNGGGTNGTNWSNNNGNSNGSSNNGNGNSGSNGNGGNQPNSGNNGNNPGNNGNNSGNNGNSNGNGSGNNSNGNGNGNGNN